MNKITLALVITKPGHLRNGLQSLLRTIPQIEITAESHDPSVLLKMSGEIHPELILLDAGLLAEMDWSAISNLKTEWPETTILILTETEKQNQSAKEAGADFTLPKGSRAAELVDLIENMLISNERDEIK